jgi:hypothetical protein
MSIEDKRLIRWLLVTIVVGALLLALLVHLGFPLNPMFANRLTGIVA